MGGEQRAADPDNLHLSRREPAAQGRDEARGEIVAGGFAGHHEQAEGAVRFRAGFDGLHHAASMKRPSSSASAMVLALSAIITDPTVTPTPARPAAAAPLMVDGPMVGRSMRMSCPSLGP